MIGALQFDGWQWVALALATPVATWGAWPFHRAMLANLRHGRATMDTLVSVGVLAAYGWSLWALVATDAGDVGGDMAMAGGDTPHLYLEVASTVVALILAGRYLEARAKRRAGAALRALLDLGAKDVAVVQTDGTEQRVPVEQLVVGDRFVVRPGEKVATDGVVDDGVSAIDASLVTGESVPRRGRPGRPRRGRDGQRRRTARRARPHASGPTRSWPRWPGWSSRRSPARRGCSAWPIGSPVCSCRSSSRSRWPRWPAGCSPPATPAARSTRRSPCSSSPAPARSGWRRRRPCSSARAAGPSSAC